MSDKQKLRLLEYLVDRDIDVYAWHFNAYEDSILHLNFLDAGGNYHHIGFLSTGEMRTYEEEMV